MKTNEDIKDYLLKMGVEFQSPEEGLWVLKLEPSNLTLVMKHEQPILEFLVNVAGLPKKNLDAFYRRLLEWNATEVVHGAYGLIGDKVVMTMALQTENLDYNELQAAIESIALQLQIHYSKLKTFYK